MAKQTGILQVDGSLGGLNFYKRLGKPVVRRAGGGFTRKAIKSKASMVRVRENNSEFGRCASSKKYFLLSLKQMFGDFKLAELHGRMMQLFLEVKNMDNTSARGERRISVALQNEEARKLFSGFQVNPQFSVPELICKKFEYDAATGLILKKVSGDKFLNAADRRLELQFGRLGFDFDSNSSEFTMADSTVLTPGEEINELNFTSPPLAASFPLELGVLQACLFSEVNGKTYPLKGDSNFGIRLFL